MDTRSPASVKGRTGVAVMTETKEELMERIAELEERLEMASRQSSIEKIKVLNICFNPDTKQMRQFSFIPRRQLTFRSMVSARIEWERLRFADKENCPTLWEVFDQYNLEYARSVGENNLLTKGIEVARDEIGVAQEEDADYGESPV